MNHEIPKILILGAGGMLGHKLCQDLPKLGYSVTGTIRRAKSYYDQYKYIFKEVDLIDKLGPNGLASSTKNISKFFSNLQTGYIYHYVFSFIIGMALLISFVIFFL